MQPEVYTQRRTQLMRKVKTAKCTCAETNPAYLEVGVSGVVRELLDGKVLHRFVGRHLCNPRVPF